MSKQAPFYDLIARLEKATGPDEGLDNAIAEALGWTRRPATHEEIGDYLEWVSPGGRGWEITASACCPLGRLTASIDAALTLVPEGANCHGYDLDPNGADAYFSLNNVKSGHWVASGYHKTSPAIALCIAALKARATKTETPT